MYVTKCCYHLKGRRFLHVVGMCLAQHGIIFQETIIVCTKNVVLICTGWLRIRL